MYVLSILCNLMVAYQLQMLYTLKKKNKQTLLSKCTDMEEDFYG